MELKPYQSESLNILRRYLERARTVGPKAAFDAITGEPEQRARLGNFLQSYTALSGLPDVPHVCLRLPTGGGKTILGAHAVPIVGEAWMDREYPLVLWLVPSNTIRTQTVDALRKPEHPYRRVLDDAFSGRVRIFDIAEFETLRPHDLRDNCCLVVGTIQTLRTSSTEGRKVYAHNEELEPHFTRLTGGTQGMETREDGGVKYSFANLLHLHRPFMVVDESHNAVTGLSRTMQQRVNPSAILELTATPVDRNQRLISNILHTVTAQELKDAEMVKLPIMLSENQNWEQAVTGAIEQRAALAEKAKGEREFLRPIVLLQAQNQDEEVPVETLKAHLTDVHNIPERRIAVATGNQRELDNIDLFDPQCEIEYVITVQALKEGWDCSFAYIFCSVSSVKSARAVEQLLGRVLRMPYAQRRRDEDLNKAYAFVSEPEFGEAARSLVDQMVAMGFDEADARDNVESLRGGLQPPLPGDNGLFGRKRPPAPTFQKDVPAAQGLADRFAAVGHSGVSIEDVGDGKARVKVEGTWDEHLERVFYEVLPESEHQGFAEEAKNFKIEIEKHLSPAERGETMTVPALLAEVQHELVLADTDTFLEFDDWSILDFPAHLDENEFHIREEDNRFYIDVKGERVKYGPAAAQGALGMDVPVEGWTKTTLVRWLERRVRNPHLAPEELNKWLGDLIDYLTTHRGLSLTALMRSRFRLAQAVRDKIQDFDTRARKNRYQRLLFQPEARVRVSFEEGFVFREGMFAHTRRYHGRWEPAKHFLGPDEVPAFDGAQEGEEIQCAQALDALSEVKHWVRNVAQHPNAFRLPLHSGFFYPDFVAELHDGRLFVVEYKGAHIRDDESTREKRLIGELWEQASDGHGLFLMVYHEANGQDKFEQMRHKLNSS